LYIRDSFYAHMFTAQRNEFVYVIFDGYIYLSNNMRKCYKVYMRMEIMKILEQCK